MRGVAGKVGDFEDGDVQFLVLMEHGGVEDLDGGVAVFAGDDEGLSLGVGDDVVVGDDGVISDVEP